MDSRLVVAISKTIKERRIEQGLSQEDLASLCNLDRTYISGIERQTRNPTIKTLNKILVALAFSEKTFLEKVSLQLDKPDV